MRENPRRSREGPFVNILRSETSSNLPLVWPLSLALRVAATEIFKTLRPLFNWKPSAVRIDSRGHSRGRFIIDIHCFSVSGWKGDVESRMAFWSVAGDKNLLLYLSKQQRKYRRLHTYADFISSFSLMIIIGEGELLLSGRANLIKWNTGTII